MASFGSRRGEAGARALPLMFGAIVVAGGFFTWLFFQAAPVEVEVVEGGAVEEDFATVVPLEVFGMDPLAQEGMDIRLDLVGVQNSLGAEAFFVLGIPEQANPYLIKMTPEAVTNDGVPESGATVSVSGMVHAMSDSVADAWVASGGIGEGDRIVAVFAESFFEARAVRVTAPPQPQDN